MSLGTSGIAETMAVRLTADDTSYSAAMARARTATDDLAKAQARQGMSAAQLQAAQRNLPAQFTDIFTSLASGQQPLTVLLQQGGQVKDMFGGVGAAARAMGSYVAGLVNPISVTVGVLGAVAVAAHKAQAQNYELAKAVAATGGASGLTAGQVHQLATDMDALAGMTRSRATAALTEFVAQGVAPGSEALKQFAATAVAWERVTGTAVADTAKAFGQLERNPVDAALKLNDGLKFLTASTYARIRALEDQGRREEAAAIAQQAYANALQTATNQIKPELGALQVAWKAVGDVAAAAWDKMLGVGRKLSLAEQIGDVEREIAALERAAQRPRGDGGDQRRAAQLSTARELLTNLKDRAREESSLAAKQAAAAATRQQQLEAQQRWMDRDKANLSEQAKLQREVDQIRRDGLALGLAEADIAKQIAAARAKAGPSDAQKFAAEAAALRAKLEGERDGTHALGEAQQRLNKFVADYDAGVLHLSATEAARREGVLHDLVLIEREIALNKEAAKVASERAAMRAKDDAAATEAARANAAAVADALRRDLDSSKNAVTRLQDEADAAKLAARANITLADALRRVAMARTQAKLAEAEQDAQRLAAIAADDATMQQAASEAARRVYLLRDRLSLDFQAAELARAAERRDTEAKQWQSIEQTAHAAFVDVAQSGVSAFQRIGRTIKASVLDMLWQATARPWLIQIGTALGLPGAAAAGAGLNAASSLGGLGGLGAALGSSSAYGAALGTTATGAGSQAAMLAAQTGEFGAAGLSATASAAGGTMSTVMAAAPYVAAAMAVLAIAKKLDNSGTLHTGGGASFSAAGGLATGNGHDMFGLRIGEMAAGADTINAVSASMQAVVGLLDSVASTFGRARGYSAAGAYANDTSSDPGWGDFAVRDASGAMVIGGAAAQGRWARRQDYAEGDAGMRAYLGDVSTQVRDYLTTQVPAWAQAALQALGESPQLDTLAQAVDQINAAQVAMAALGAVSGPWAAATEAATAELVRQLGGLQSATQALGGYYANYYSDAERAAVATRQIADELARAGLAMPTTREQFRALVDSALQAGDGGAATAATLLRVQAAFAAATPATEAVTTATDDLAAAQRRAADVAQERDRLERELLQATGNTIALRERERAALDATNRALYDRINAVNDMASAENDLATAQAAAQREQYQAALAVAQQAQAAADRMRDLGRSLDEFLAGQTGDAQQQFGAVLARAMAGDTAAMQSLPQAATGAIDLANQRAASATDAAIARARITSAVAQVAAKARAAGAVSVAMPVDPSAQGNDTATRLATAVDRFTTALGAMQSTIARDIVTGWDAIANGQGAINWQQFQGYFKGTASDSVLTKIWLALDADGSGLLTRLEAIRANTGATALSQSALAAALAAELTARPGSTQAQITQQAGTYGATASEVDAAYKQQAAITAALGAELAARPGTTYAAMSAYATSTYGLTQAQIDLAYTQLGIPKFASGGMHLGGLRLVGERGPEIEATGPARYWSATDTAAMLRGAAPAAETNAMLAELRQLRAALADANRVAEQAALSASITAKTLQTLRNQGVLVYTDAADPLVTTPA